MHKFLINFRCIKKYANRPVVSFSVGLFFLHIRMTSAVSKHSEKIPIARQLL